MKLGWRPFAMMPYCILRSDLSSGAKLLFLYLISFGPSIYPSYRVLQILMGRAGKKASSRTVSKCLRELSEANLIGIKRGSLISGEASEYFINPPSEWLLQPKRFRKQPESVTAAEMPARSLPKVKTNHINSRLKHSDSKTSVQTDETTSTDFDHIEYKCAGWEDEE